MYYFHQWNNIYEKYIVNCDTMTDIYIVVFIADIYIINVKVSKLSNVYFLVWISNVFSYNIVVGH